MAEISIHAPRVGSDAEKVHNRILRSYFNPRSPCGERRRYELGQEQKIAISIHAPRVGSDFPRIFSRTWRVNFNPRSPCGERPRLAISFGRFQMISIHAPRVGSDSRMNPAYTGVSEFQSTLPVWGATMISRRRTKSSKNFNPRSPCGERPAGCWALRTATKISIHAPRVGSDFDRLDQSHARYIISIHAPRVGSDPCL